MATTIRDYPLLVFLVTFSLLWLAEKIGAMAIRGLRGPAENVRQDVGIIQAAVLTLLGLLIGFCFAMAVSRYDQRKLYEEAEANAIGTEYVRAGLLPAADGEQVRSLLREYVQRRLAFFTVHDARKLQQIDTATAALHARLWSVVERNAADKPNVIIGLVVAGMNDVLNAEGYTQSSWWNRIPDSAWTLMLLVAACSNALVGYGLRKAESTGNLLLVLPMVVGVSFALIADIDSPRGGLIHVEPYNLMRLASSIHAH
ncbi:hypothetical protein CupriaWKF_10225 [Cupriavidus sp. WKF15]|uniref:bestrophin-like domain n=1 Tax=Cupriavidus sp. WKF15 TaxID=3032282 RepID=UPI0023E22AFF|nr:hypothetical protein [Cupriavidus sp. WKF15]WER44719.1 hypothetical protein CupriaWKF_10225 [Cupriavidus sp. WKF15]